MSNELLRPYVKIPTRVAPGNLPWWIADLCRSYDWPIAPLLGGGIGDGSTGGVPGGGVIGIVELGGGYYPADLAQFFQYGTAPFPRHVPLPAPNVTDVSVDPGASNSPGSDADVEVALDMQIAGAAYAMATGMPATIRMYWANNDLNAITRCIARAAADGCDVLSISWGSDEATWGTTSAAALETAADNAAAGGMITFAASGDNDSSDGGPTPANVDLPASAPHVTGCGGTMRPHASNQEVGPQEVVWNNDPGKSTGVGTGGGDSTLWAKPSWQVGAPAGTIMRMVPDVAGNADPQTGYHIVYQGQDIVVGGTSAVAPLCAGLFASFGRKLGFINPILWANAAIFRDITVGDNGAYRALVGPDPCTGLGTLYGAKLSSLFVR